MNSMAERETHLSRYSLKRFAIRTSCSSRPRVQFSRNRLSYSCTSQCGMYTIVGPGSAYAAIYVDKRKPPPRKKEGDGV